MPSAAKPVRQFDVIIIKPPDVHRFLRLKRATVRLPAPWKRADACSRLIRTKP